MSYRNEDYHGYSGVDFTEHSGVNFEKYSDEELVKLWRATLKRGMHGICFSMYEDGQEPGDTITEAQVERRIKILMAERETSYFLSPNCMDSRRPTFLNLLAGRVG